MYARAALAKSDLRFHWLPLTGADPGVTKTYCGLRARRKNGRPVIYVPDVVQLQCPACVRGWANVHCTTTGTREYRKA